MTFKCVILLLILLSYVRSSPRTPGSSFQQRAASVLISSGSAFLLSLWSRATPANSLDSSSSSVDLKRLRAEVNCGGVYVHDNWIDTALVYELQKDILNAETEGKFKPAGLSNKALQKQSFSDLSDRSMSIP